MKNWIIYYLGMVIVCFIGNLIVENTKFADFTSKIMNFILAVSITIPIISAVIGLSNGNAWNKNVFGLDDKLVGAMNSYKINLVYYELIEQLDEIGVRNCDISFQTSEENGGVVITKVCVNLSESEYDGSNLNIDLIKNAVTQVCKVGSEFVEIYG